MTDKTEPVESVKLTGMFHGEMVGDNAICKAICTIMPDPDELDGRFAGQQLSLCFDSDFRSIMREVGIPRRLGTPVLFHNACRVQGALQINPYSPNQFEIIDIVSIEILDSSHCSYVPNRVYDVSHVLWFSDKNLVLRGCRSMDDVVAQTPRSVSRVRVRGFLLANPHTETSVLLPYVNLTFPDSEESHVPYEQFAKLTLHKNNFLLDSNFASVIHNYLPRRSALPDPPDVPPIFGGWAVIDGDFRQPDSGTSATGVISNITCISIESNRRLLQRVWWDPTYFVWHDQDLEEGS